MMMKNILRGLGISRRAIRERYSSKIALLARINECEVHLTSLYMLGFRMKQELHEKLDENFLLSNATLNMPYRYYSIMLLIKNSMFGGARDLMRQYLEELVIAKYSEVDKSITEKWDQDKPISFTRDVLNKMKGKQANEIKAFWQELCRYSHATRFAMQPPLLPPVNDDVGDVNGFIEETLLPNIEYTLDMFFILTMMNFHLLTSHMGKRSHRWWFGYPHDPYGTSRRENELKQRVRETARTYLDSIVHDSYVRKHFAKMVYEYRQSW